MKKDIIEYILSTYKGSPCIYNNKVLLYFKEFEDDDSFHNAYDLTQLYLDFLKIGDQVTIDNDDYFIDIDMNEIIFIQNDYQIVNKRLLELTCTED